MFGSEDVFKGLSIARVLRRRLPRPLTPTHTPTHLTHSNMHLAYPTHSHTPPVYPTALISLYQYALTHIRPLTHPIHSCFHSTPLINLASYLTHIHSPHSLTRPLTQPSSACPHSTSLTHTFPLSHPTHSCFHVPYLPMHQSTSFTTHAHSLFTSITHSLTNPSDLYIPPSIPFIHD